LAKGTRTSRRPKIPETSVPIGAAKPALRSAKGRAADGIKEGRMLQSSENSYGGVRSTSPASNPNSYNPVKTTTAPIEQATIGRSLVIKGEITGAEALYIDGRIEGKITLTDNRVTIGRNGVVQADITAREVVVMGKVTGNIECTDRVDIRSEGLVNGNVLTERISVEDGAVLKGGIEVRSGQQKQQNRQQPQAKAVEAPKPSAPEPPKALAATAGA
jgi:cytoskeletal protein CcmA (bactofilin family)